ncbi:tetratricopeptide repeat protein [Flavobacterium sp. K5-23]|uniref:tetratricopeptide repeat-containing sensor histidine kinase n=1 Tax=Flavobacterium sp. K5-23 TaxID=2746225 RepID=UPI00200E84BF|nr:tetratricopeptide repeat protein [Flavobacterium sp. K5-23]UQD55529.1 tetratricopeptide repeat-containing sensor histidine kinase [Flavobacterium sp. K5-23]
MKNWFLGILIFINFSLALGQSALKKDVVTTKTQINSSDSSRISFHLKKANSYSIQNVDSASYQFNKAIEIAHSLNSTKDVAEVLYSQGLFFHNNYKYVKAIKFFNEADLLFEELKNHKKTGLINDYIGKNYSYLYSYDKAFKHFLKALKHYQQIGDEIGSAKVYSGIGNIYYLKKQYDISIKYFTKSFSLYKKNNNELGIADSYTNLANAVSDNGDFDKGLEYYNKSNVILIRLKDKYGIATNYNNIGDCYIVLKKYNYALDYFEKALALSQDINDLGLTSIIYSNIANIKKAQNNFKETVDYANKSLKIAVEINDLGIQSESLLTLSKVYEDSNDFQMALKFKNQYIAIKDSMLLQDNTEKAHFFQALNDLESNQSTINELTIKNENNRLKLEYKNRLSSFFIVTSILSIIFIVFLIFQQRAKRKTYKLLAYKSEQVVKMKDEIQTQHDRLKDLNSTKDKLFKILAHDLKNPLSSIEGFTDLMIEDGAGSDEEERMLFLTTIKNSANKASSILNGLFIWAINQEKILKTKKINLFSLLKDEVKLLEIQALYKKVSVLINVENNIYVKADEDMLGTVLRNLISNAIKFTHSKGEILVTSKIADNFVEITIKDNGVGMTMVEVEGLFRVDYNVSKEGTANENGSGLGLVLCKDFIEKQGGKIWVQSIVNVGSEFKFTLPLYINTKEQKKTA